MHIKAYNVPQVNNILSPENNGNLMMNQQTVVFYTHLNKILSAYTKIL